MQQRNNIQTVDDVFNELEGIESPQEQEKQKTRDQLFKDAIVATMSHRNGRRFVHKIFEQAGVMRQPFTGVRETTDFNLGQQNIGYWLFSLIDLECPELYLTMLKEAKEDANV